mmetsp:Transcript_19821/g.34022  ORF Transcript_19821/g.34022 Transcript_19821/m.34022 type:complete len:179 (-) Transcript_19821:1873-2409(-)
MEPQRASDAASTVRSKTKKSQAPTALTRPIENPSWDTSPNITKGGRTNNHELTISPTQAVAAASVIHALANAAAISNHHQNPNLIPETETHIYPTMALAAAAPITAIKSTKASTTTAAPLSKNADDPSTVAAAAAAAAATTATTTSEVAAGTRPAATVPTTPRPARARSPWWKPGSRS